MLEKQPCPLSSCFVSSAIFFNLCFSSSAFRLSFSIRVRCTRIETIIPIRIINRIKLKIPMKMGKLLDLDFFFSCCHRRRHRRRLDRCHCRDKCFAVYALVVPVTRTRFLRAVQTYTVVFARVFLLAVNATLCFRADTAVAGAALHILTCPVVLARIDTTGTSHRHRPKHHISGHQCFLCEMANVREIIVVLQITLLLPC